MKSVLQACWLVTTAFGDLIVVLLEIIHPVDGVVSNVCSEKISLKEKSLRQ